MRIVIDNASEEAPFAQLISQIKTAVSEGHLSPGDALPSIRQLAGDLNLNHKTIAKAYKILERDLVIKAKGYRGTFIHPEAKNHSGNDIRVQIRNILSESIHEAIQTGATSSEIRAVFNDLINNETK